jgi:hypothetical protein
MQHKIHENQQNTLTGIHGGIRLSMSPDPSTDTCDLTC